jgi:hypothetical protein
LSSDITVIPCADTVEPVEGNITKDVKGETLVSTAESKARCMGGNSKRENREIPGAGGRKSPAAARKLHRR